MLTITLHGSEFSVREDVVETIKGLTELASIQTMLVELFTALDDVHADEYALAVAVYFPNSKAWALENRHGRCAADVRKFNKASFKCQNDVPETPVRMLGLGVRRSSVDPKAVADALKALDEQTS